MLRAVVATVLLILFLGAALLLPAGDLHWPMAWVFLVAYTAFAIVALLVLDPELIAERSRRPPDAKRSDVVMSSAFFVFLYPGTLVVCGLDRRFGWSPPIDAVAQWLALAVFLSGYGFSLWAMRCNRFFSTFLRIQRERGHQVIDSGPYAMVRHPGYAGAIVAHLAVPIALGSLWGLAPVVVGVALLVVRTAWEDRTLADELPGYRDYTLRVPWRLMPYVW